MAVGMVAITLAGCTGESKEIRTSEAVKVKTVAVENTINDAGTKYSGTIEENTGTSVSFANAGTVKQVLVKNGQAVHKGQLIATIDNTTLLNAYNAAHSILSQAEDAYKRMKQLHDTNSISEMQWVEVQSKLEQARSSEQMARHALSDTRLVAPASGVVSDKNLEPGQNVMPGITVMKIVEINKVKVNISIPESEISAIANGNEVTVTVQALDNRMYKGVVTEKNVTANALSRTYDIKATINNPDHQLMPGMICEAVISGKGMAQPVMSLPIDAVQLSDKNFYYVWLNHNGKAKKQFVTVGTVTSTGVTITDGLKQGDNVIVEGMQKVSEGTSLSIVK